MKKIFSILALAMLLTAVPAHAQLDKGFHLGVKAGLNFSNMSAPGDAFDEGFLKTYTGFNAGLVFNFNLPLGFEFAPELLYVQSGFKASSLPPSCSTCSPVSREMPEKCSVSL